MVWAPFSLLLFSSIESSSTQPKLQSQPLTPPRLERQRFASLTRQSFFPPEMSQIGNNCLLTGSRIDLSSHPDTSICTPFQSKNPFAGCRLIAL
jgi:hypothetical protein